MATRDGSKLKRFGPVELSFGFRSAASDGKCACRREYSKLSRMRNALKSAIKLEAATKLMFVQADELRRVPRVSRRESVRLGKVPAASSLDSAGLMFSVGRRISEISASIFRGTGLGLWGFIHAILEHEVFRRSRTLPVEKPICKSLALDRQGVVRSRS